MACWLLDLGLQYNDVSDIIGMLKDIYTSSSHYEEIAENGRQTILNLHNNFSITKQLFSLF